VSKGEDRPGEDKDAPLDEDNRERCGGNDGVIDYHGKRHTPHWWKMYTKWCDGKIVG
jgi:hypothetical protein